MYEKRFRKHLLPRHTNDSDSVLLNARLGVDLIRRLHQKRLQTNPNFKKKRRLFKYWYEITASHVSFVLCDLASLFCHSDTRINERTLGIVEGEVINELN